MAKPTVLYVDDESSTEARRFQERLNRDSIIDCRLLPPPKWNELDQFAGTPPDLFLIDYDLGLVQPDNTKAGYQGSTLASEIRSRHPDSPIVLISRQSIIDHLDPRTRRQLDERTQACDELIYKSDLDDDLGVIQQKLVALAQGFQLLHETEEKTWEALTGLLFANEEESQILREAAPPLKHGEWIVTGAADWIRNVVLEYPGILYDSVNAATRLGISVDSFFKEQTQSFLQPAKYGGVFVPLEGRWWKSRLFRLAKELIIEQQVAGPQNRAFAEAFQKKFNMHLEPAICVWDHAPVADWVCYLLEQPVKIKNSLRYYPDSRPSVMDDARVSFRAVRESNDFDQKLLDAEGLALLQGIEGRPEP